jgi:transposase
MPSASTTSIACSATGFRIAGRTQWLHIFSTALLTFYRISSKRGSLLTSVVGIVVHDHWKPYYTMTGVLHALCNAHHLRELKALVEIEKEEWARKMQRLLRRACHAVNLARERGVPLKPRLIELFRRRYDGILKEGIAFHESQPLLVRTTTEGQRKRRGRQRRRTGHNLLLRLSTRKEDVLRFLVDPGVPFSNNQAEQDGRMMKVRQKISGGFRSDDEYLRHQPNCHLNRQKAGLERAADPHSGSESPDPIPPIGLIAVACRSPWHRSSSPSRHGGLSLLPQPQPTLQFRFTGFQPRMFRLQPRIFFLQRSVFRT